MHTRSREIQGHRNIKEGLMEQGEHVTEDGVTEVGVTGDANWQENHKVESERRRMERKYVLRWFLMGRCEEKRNRGDKPMQESSR